MDVRDEPVGKVLSLGEDGTIVVEMNDGRVFTGNLVRPATDFGHFPACSPHCAGGGTHYLAGAPT